MNDVITLEEGSRNHFHGALFLSKNKHYTLDAVYLKHQDIYIVDINSKETVHFLQKLYRLVPRENCTVSKYCKLLKHKKFGYSLRVRGFDLYNITDEGFNTLLKKEEELNNKEDIEK